MNKIIALGTYLLCIAMCADYALAVEGYEMLFKDTESKLTRPEKQQIFKSLGFSLSKNRKYLIDDTCGEDISPNVEVVDLNGDGTEEIIVNWGNTCTSGMAGQSVTLFIKNRNGQFMKNLGFPGTFERLSSINMGFPNLMSGGPGFCHGVWRWTGEKYNYKCSREERAGACTSAGVERICK